MNNVLRGLGELHAGSFLAENMLNEQSIAIFELSMTIQHNKMYIAEFRSDAQEEANRVIMLIPELTYLTGMSDAMRADFRVMKDIAVHTRITPDQRRAFLQKFVQR